MIYFLRQDVLSLFLISPFALYLVYKGYSTYVLFDFHPLSLSTNDKFVEIHFYLVIYIRGSARVEDAHDIRYM